MKIFLSIIATIILLNANAQLPGPLQVLVDAEKSFAQTSATSSTKNAFVNFMADDGILFKPGPVAGKKFWQDAPQGNDKLTWEPRYADIAAAGDLGYTTGPFEQRINRNDEQPAGGGHYLSIWKKQANNEWKVVLDIGIGHPPATYPRLTGSAITAKAVGTNIFSTGELMKIEEAFSKAQHTNGLSVYNDWLSKEAKIFRPMSAPFETKESIESFINATDKKFSYTPAKAFIATSGDLGYVYGTGTVEISQGDNKRLLNTNYVRIWKKEDGKNWKIVIDLVAVAR